MLSIRETAKIRMSRMSGTRDAEDFHWQVLRLQLDSMRTRPIAWRYSKNVSSGRLLTIEYAATQTSGAFRLIARSFSA